MPNKNLTKRAYYSLGRFLKRNCPRIMSDKYFLKVTWKKYFGYDLDLKHPKTLNEKLQWLKAYDHNPLYTKLADKYEMKQTVRQLTDKPVNTIPTIAVYDRVQDIDWEGLPDSFVMKCTHDSGSIVICKDKNTFDIKAAEQKLDSALKFNYFLKEREWAYKNIKPRIIVEPFLSNDDGSALVDYKFYIYGGELKYWMYSVGETEHTGTNLKFSPTKECIDYLFKETPRMKEEDVRLPDNIDEMIHLAEELGKPFRHVRIDMYNVNGTIYIGEFTFYSSGGFISIRDSEYSQELADAIQID